MRYNTPEEVPYDEELPYAVLTRFHRDLMVVARFTSKDAAEAYMGTLAPAFYVLRDTAPKPRIPEGAEYITWTSGHKVDGSPVILMAVRVGHPGNKVWQVSGGGGQVTEKTLLLAYPNVEFTELIKKESN